MIKYIKIWLWFYIHLNGDPHSYKNEFDFILRHEDFGGFHKISRIVSARHELADIVASKGIKAVSDEIYRRARL